MSAITAKAADVALKVVAMANKIKSDYVASSDVRRIVRITESNYAALTPDPDTLYIVVEDPV